MTIIIEYGKGFPKFAAVDGDAHPAALAVGGISGVRCTAGCTRFPLETRLLELLLQRTNGSLGLNPNVTAWYNERVRKEKARAELMLLEDVELDHPMSSRLWSFQRVGAHFAAKLGKTLLCDQCGLGKTATAIVASELTRWHRKMLIVCPNSLKQWWAQEIPKWSKDSHEIKVVESRTRAQQLASFKEGWLIINYEQVFREPQLKKMFFDWMICDEAHRLKNRRTKTFKAVQQIRSRRRLLLTGTPFGNNPAELWAPLHLLDPERYVSYWRFFDMYVDSVENRWSGGREILGVRNPELLRRELSTIMVRRKKEDVLKELPEKIYQTVPLGMRNDQLQLYKKTSREYLIKLEDEEDIDIPNMAVMILRLRQILSSPQAFGLETSSCKVEAAMDIVNSSEEKIILFTEFRATVEHLTTKLKKCRIGFARIMGGLDVAAAVRKFQNNPSCRVLVGTTATGGVGLTLTASRTIVFLDKHWNPMQQQQAEDRVHRIGQARQVHIIDLRCPGTVDDLVEKVLTKKLVMTRAVLQEELAKVLESWV